MLENEITQRILKCAFRVHSALGPGLLESSYKECLAYEMTDEGLYVEKEKPMPLVYRDVKLDIGYRIDLFVEHRVVVEIKVVEAFNDVHLAQILTYLKLSQSKVGLLLNFHTSSLKNGIKRVIL
ncbi:MAG: GxxExxY protein [Bacteroidota bacterium]